MKASSFAPNRLKILLHLLAWAILVGLPLYFNKRWQVGNDFIWLYYINILIAGIIFYINYLLLIPKLFFRTRRHWYFMAALLTLLAFYFVSDRSNGLVFRYITGRQNTEQLRSPENGEARRMTPDREQHGPPGEGRFRRPPFRQIHAFNFTFTALFMLFFSLVLRILERQSRIEKLQKEMEKEKLNSELAFLKNQVSPHFFFNTLNNIYALIGINADDSRKAVLKLSKLMRYLLYESEHGDTRLSQEIEFMYNYIDLMKLRINEKIELSVSFPEKYTDINFPPLLFVPFIENAFKHGVSYRKKSFIRIAMSMDEDSILFSCSNRIVDEAEKDGEEQSGIGLENVTKRLKLLFPGRHDLRIEQSDNEYRVLLKITISS
jgi:two-component system LytT family sensor kinase